MWEDLKVSLEETAWRFSLYRKTSLSQKIFFNSAVKADFVQETHHYCTAAWHAKGSSVTHTHRHAERKRRKLRRSVNPFELAAHLQYKLCIE